MIAPSRRQKNGSDSSDHARSALHQIDVFDRDRAAVAEIDDEDGEPDRGLGGRDGEHEQREDLADEVAEDRSRTPRG